MPNLPRRQSFKNVPCVKSTFPELQPTRSRDPRGPLTKIMDPMDFLSKFIGLLEKYF